MFAFASEAYIAVVMFCKYTRPSVAAFCVQLGTKRQLTITKGTAIKILLTQDEKSRISDSFNIICEGKRLVSQFVLVN
jgi:DNA polymerase II large subunit